MKTAVSVEGLKEINQELTKVVKEMEDDLQMGTDDAANKVAGMLRNNAPIGPKGNLRKAVTIKPLPRRSNYPQVTMVGLDYKTAPHQHLVEFGSGPRYDNGAYRGQMSATPFFRRTIDGAKGVIMSSIKVRASKALEGKGG